MMDTCGTHSVHVIVGISTVDCVLRHGTLDMMIMFQEDKVWSQSKEILALPLWKTKCAASHVVLYSNWR